MSSQTRKTFVHLRNTNYDVFDLNRRAILTSIDSNATEMFPGPDMQ